MGRPMLEAREMKFLASITHQIRFSHPYSRCVPRFAISITTGDLSHEIQRFLSHKYSHCAKVFAIVKQVSNDELRPWQKYPDLLARLE